MFGASSELAPNMFGASSELASVMEFGFNGLQAQTSCDKDADAVTFHGSRRPREMYCVSVCVSVRSRMPTLLYGPGCNLAEW